MFIHDICVGKYDVVSSNKENPFYTERAHADAELVWIGTDGDRASRIRAVHTCTCTEGALCVRILCSVRTRVGGVRTRRVRKEKVIL